MSELAIVLPPYLILKKGQGYPTNLPKHLSHGEANVACTPPVQVKIR